MGRAANTYAYILRNDLMPLIERIVATLPFSPDYVVTVFAHQLKRLEGRYGFTGFCYEQVFDMFNFIHKRGLDPAILKAMLPISYQNPKMEFNSILIQLHYEKADRERILSLAPSLNQMFADICRTKREEANIEWIMGNLRKLALGNIDFAELREAVKDTIAERTVQMIDLFKGYKGQALSVLKNFHIRVWGEAVVQTTRGEFKGIVLPRAENDDDQHIVIKIASGYNVGIDVNTIVDMKEVGYREAHYKIPEKEFPYHEGRPNVKLLGTGGHHRLATGLPHRRGDSRVLARRALRRRARAGRHLQPHHREALCRVQREHGPRAIQEAVHRHRRGD
jgi:hypothetical protein